MGGSIAPYEILDWNATPVWDTVQGVVLLTHIITRKGNDPTTDRSTMGLLCTNCLRMSTIWTEKHKLFSFVPLWSVNREELHVIKKDFSEF